MQLAKNVKISMSECLFCNRMLFFIYFPLILFPTWWKHSTAPQTVSVTDDRLMKRLQSRPTGQFCKCSKKALSDVRVVSASWWSYKCTLNHMWTRLDGSGGNPGGAVVTYSTERNMILNNCKHSRVAWTVCSNTDTFHSHLPCWWWLILYNEHTLGWFQWHLEG